MKLVIDIKNEKEYKKIKSYLDKNHITIIDIQQNLLDEIEKLSWEMGEKKISSRDEIYD